MRPKREIKAPARFGQWDEAEEHEAAEEEAERPVKRARRNPAVQGEDEVADVVQEAINAPAEVPTPAGKPEQRSGAGGSGRGRLALHTPCSRDLALAALNTCPELMDLIVERDNVRSVTLVARDVASLARALCATSDDLSELWRLFAEGCSHRIGSSSTMPQAMHAVQAAVQHDPARTRKICQSSAKKNYRLTDTELKGLRFEAALNPHGDTFAPMKLFNDLQCKLLAHRKFGDAFGVDQAATAAAQRYHKSRATHREHVAQRRSQVEASMAAVGLEPTRFRNSRDVEQFAEHGLGSPAAIAAALKAQEDDKRSRQQRLQQLRRRLEEEGLGSEMSCQPSANYLRVGGDLEAAVEAVRLDKQRRVARAQRQREVAALLQKQGLPKAYQNLPVVQRYVQKGEGSVQSVMAVARASREQRQQAQQAQQAQKQARQGQQEQQQQVVGQLLGWQQGAQGLGPPLTTEQLLACQQQWQQWQQWQQQQQLQQQEQQPQEQRQHDQPQQQQQQAQPAIKLEPQPTVKPEPQPAVKLESQPAIKLEFDAPPLPILGQPAAPVSAPASGGSLPQSAAPDVPIPDLAGLWMGPFSAPAGSSIPENPYSNLFPPAPPVGSGSRGLQAQQANVKCAVCNNNTSSAACSAACGRCCGKCCTDAGCKRHHKKR